MSEGGEKQFDYLAELAFKAYNDQAGGKTWDGKDIPPFAEVGEKVQANWRAAVKAVWDDLQPKEAPKTTEATEPKTE